MEMPVTFVVDELTMRPPAESDRSRYMAILNESDEISRWTTIPFPYTDEAFDSFLAFDGVRYVIEREGAVVGGIDSRAEWETATAMFGYWLAPAGRGVGAITRSGRALCELLIERGIQRIVAEVVVGNLASGAVLDRLGFTLEGVARSIHAGSCGSGQERMDEQIWSLLPGELTEQ